MRFFVRTTENDTIWEEVNEHIFHNRKFAIRADGQPRYSEDFIQIHKNGQISIEGIISAEELGKICRLLSVSVPTGSFTPITQEPESVEIHKGRSKYLHHIPTNQNWYRKAA